MNGGPRWRVVVVDDSQSFAAHVARFVLRRLAFGERRSLDEPGSPANSSNGRLAWLAAGAEIPSDDGLGSFVWIDGAKARARHLAGQARWLREGPGAGGRRMVLILDRRQELTREQALEVFDREGVRKQVEVEVWSAYHAAGDAASPIYSKSRDSLVRLRRRLARLEPKPASAAGGSSPVKHVLITGAGFEIRDGEGGFGLPPTVQLLRSLGEPFRFERGTGPAADCTLLAPGAADGDFPGWEGQEESARTDNLDHFWNALLAAETQRILGPDMQGRARAFRYEARMREAFRRVLQQHDWGHLKQAVLAAGLDWICWLTTNYTGFSDRAIDLLRPQGKRWHVIATEVEAVNVLHEEPWTGEGDPYLFKLHGELRHLHSMAIAGWDKEPFSPLWFPVDKLSQIYTAAERYLEGSVEGRGYEDVLLHVVGHGLMDERLVRLIRRTREKLYPKVSFHVVLVGRTPGRMRQALVQGGWTAADAVTEVEASAMRYLSSLHRQGFDAIRSVADWRQWLGDLRPANDGAL